MHVIYRDPVHDFAFLRCDLAALKVRARASAAQAQLDLLWRCAGAGAGEPAYGQAFCNCRQLPEGSGCLAAPRVSTL